MITEESLREVIIHDVYSRLDSLGYGKKQSGAGYVYYIVNGKRMIGIRIHRLLYKDGTKEIWH